ncbi:MAG: ribose-phosphate diphosphokinase [Methanobacteriota archaeon]|nr:MAG: ribose-phosphate diphosphokinase [Euryarchaeota archaeon]
MIVFGGSASTGLAAEVAEALGCEQGRAAVKTFPDGELFVKIESRVEKGDEALVVQSTSRPQNRNIMELLFLLDALQEMGARTAAIIPYYGYGRQDRAFEEGEAVSSKVVARHIQLSAERVLTINPHKEHILHYFDIPASSADAAPAIGRYFKEKGLERPLVVAPDAGSKALAQTVAETLGCRCGNCQKRRLGPGRVVTSAEGLELSGETVIIVDDIIDSGGTIVEASKALKAGGAGPIHVACIHPVLTGNAAQRILDHARELVATNTIDSEYSRISVAPLIAEAVRKWNL